MNAPANANAVSITDADLTEVGRNPPHESAHLHVAGAAAYIDDLPELAGTLHAAPALATRANARITRLDLDAARAVPGVVDILTAADVPCNAIGTVLHDEPVLADGETLFVGQPVALVLATSVKAARVAARRVRVGYEERAPLVDAEAALAAGSFILPPARMQRGDAAAALAAAPHRVSGELRIGGQEHFYLEGQIACVIPREDGQLLILSSTQHPGDVQHQVRAALGLPDADIVVECRRMGGGFGGKESQAAWFAVAAAVAARKHGCPVKLRADRDDDFMLTGKRHDYLVRYEAGCDGAGRLRGVRLMFASRCGYSADLSGPVNDRSVLHADNCYQLPEAGTAIDSYRLKTHMQSATAFRGFGGPQGMLAIENLLDDVARALGRDPLDVRRANLYAADGSGITHYGQQVEDNLGPPLIEQLARDCDYAGRRTAIAAFNAGSPVIKRGLALTPVKFGISFTATHYNQAGALVHVYQDGSVQVNHGGTEMGQGLHTKVRQIVADALGVPAGAVRVTASDTAKVPNASATAASSGTDLNGMAAQQAALVVRERLVEVAARAFRCAPGEVTLAAGVARHGAQQMTFAALSKQAYMQRVQLWSDGFYATPKIHWDKTSFTGRPFFYFAWGAACSEVAIDTLTGELRVLRVDILHDVGRSINPALDIGQIEGGFVQGMGWLTTEELVWDAQGRLATHAPSTYKIPVASDVPPVFNVRLWDGANREDSIHRSKAVGEPPLMLAISVLHAIRDAVSAARGGGPVQLDAPATPEAILRALHRKSGSGTHCFDLSRQPER
jgi:xanthine dehydrogenase large subunit